MNLNKCQLLSICYLKYMEEKTHNLFEITNIFPIFRSFINVKSTYKQKYR